MERRRIAIRILVALGQLFDTFLDKRTLKMLTDVSLINEGYIQHYNKHILHVILLISAISPAL